jgi:transcriptional regulator with GAF, ATPase, and Fis domain
MAVPELATGRGPLAEALAVLARPGSSNGLESVLAIVASALREVVAFDRIAVAWHEPREGVRVLAMPETEGLPVLATDALAAEGGDSLARAVTPEDGHIGLRVSLGPSAAFFVVSHAAAPLTQDQEEAVQPIAHLVGLALEHERLLAAERRRHDRSESLELLLPTLARALDVRDVFLQVSSVAQGIVPHDLLGLGMLSPDGLRIRIFAVCDGQVLEPREIPIPDALRPTLEWEFVILHHLEADREAGVVRGLFQGRDSSQLPLRQELAVHGFRLEMLIEQGIRSQLRVPVRLNGEVVGGLAFNSRHPELYGEEDAELARRIADHVSLTLAHHRLAEEARRLAEVRERTERLEAKVATLTLELEAQGPYRALGRSPAWQGALAHAVKVAPTETTVLLSGESGTGKEVVARFLHRASPRKDGPFVALNCAALPEQLLESELFGFEKGAFTGAVAARTGRIEQAAGGILFLDEVAEMSPLVQAKFLRVLQEREYRRLGGSRDLRADVRVIAASNRELAEVVSRGLFREDLYYRLNVFGIRLPPLRERVDDILLLAQAFLLEIGAAVGRPPAGLSEDARERLLAHAWPGNVRELRNAIERAVILCEGGLVTGEHLPIALRSPGPSAEPALPPGGLDLEALEKNLIQKAMSQARSNKTQAARLLGLTRAQLRSRIDKYGL